MDSIYFFIADTTMKQAVSHMLASYSDLPDMDSVTVKTEIVDFPHMVAQAQHMVRAGAKVIIPNSGSYQILSAAIHEIPILCLYSSTYDALYTLRQASRYKKIHLLLNKHFIFNPDICPPDLRAKLIIHEPYSIDDTYDQLLARIQDIPITPDTAIVGCTLLPQIANIVPLPVFPIRPSESTLLSVFQYALGIVRFQRQDRRQLSTLESILSHVTDGIILYGAGGVISHINRQASIFLGIPADTENIRTIFPDWHEGTKPSFKDRIIHQPPYTLVANSDSFISGQERQYILTLRDVTELQRLEKNIRYKLSRTGLEATHCFSDIHTTDAHMKQTIAQARLMATYNAPVLIQGESGTGKELFAQSIHNAGPRHNGPFVAINCAALPPDLLESELFGYAGGAFTGARKEGKAGLFEMAHKGTIFLDEINSMSPNIQSKLLRVLETKQVMRIGSDYIIPLDIRIISASNADILAAVQAGTFRRDLFFRINTLKLNLHPLNDRPTDIPYLFSFFLQSLGESPKELPENLRQTLLQHHWWGNIRELYSAALRYHIFGETGDRTYSYLFDAPANEGTEHLLAPGTVALDMKHLETAIQQLVIRDLMEQGYTQTEIAKLLHVSRQTIFNRLKK